MCVVRSWSPESRKSLLLLLLKGGDSGGAGGGDEVKVIEFRGVLESLALSYS